MPLRLKNDLCNFPFVSRKYFTLNHNKHFKFVHLQALRCARIRFVFIEFAKCFTDIHLCIFLMEIGIWNEFKSMLSTSTRTSKICDMQISTIVWEWTASNHYSLTDKTMDMDMKCNAFETKHVTIKLPLHVALILMFPFKFLNFNTHTKKQTYINKWCIHYCWEHFN